MPLQFNTSFAVKKSLVTQSPFSRAGRTFNLLGITAIILTVCAVALAFLVFFYRGYLLRSLAEMDTQLAAARKSFEPEFVEEASRLNSRIESSKELLSFHGSLSPLFDLLEKKTLESVRFRNFSFTAPFGSDAKLSMAGEAKSFNGVALQSDVFGSVKYFKDPVFSDFSLDDAGTVLFNFKTTVAKDFLRYAETIVASSTEADSLDYFTEDEDMVATSSDSF